MVTERVLVGEVTLFWRKMRTSIFASTTPLMWIGLALLVPCIAPSGSILSATVGGQGREDVTPRPSFTCKSVCEENNRPCGTGQACIPFNGTCLMVVAVHSARCVAGDDFHHCENGANNVPCITAMWGTADPATGGCACSTSLWTCGTQNTCAGGQ